MEQVLCFICKGSLNSEKLEISTTYTTHTSTCLPKFIENLMESAEIVENIKQFICLSCFVIINDLDYSQKRCIELKRTLIDYLTTNKSNFETNDSLTLHIQEVREVNVDIVDESNVAKGRKYCNENVNKSNENQKKKARKKPQNTVIKPHKCDKCKKTWKTLSELKMHIATHDESRSYVCEQCGQAYKHKSALEVHLGMHNGIHPFICAYCNKSFTQKGALQRHIPIHTGEFPYQCDICGKKYAHHTSFNIHRLTHTGQKDYKCKICDATLISASHLKRHTRTHTGEKNFLCPICGKRFAERYNLVSHQKLHKNSKKCNKCNEMFESCERLNNHICNLQHRRTLPLHNI